MLDKQAVAVLAVLFGAWFAYYSLYQWPREAAWREQQVAEARRKAAEAEDAGDAAPVGTASPAAPKTPEDDPEAAPAGADAPPAPQAEPVLVDMETSEHVLQLDSAGASIRQLTFKDILHSSYAPLARDVHPEEPYQPLVPFTPKLRSFALLPLEDDEALRWIATTPWAHEPLEDGGHRFTLDLPGRGLRLVKTYTPPEALPDDVPEGIRPYHLNLTVRVENTSGEEQRFGYALNGPVGMIQQSSGRADLGLQAVAGARVGGEVELQTITAAELVEPDEPPFRRTGAVSFYGLGTKYFAAVVIPERKEQPIQAVEGAGVRRFLGQPPRPDAEDHNAPGNQAFVRGIVPEFALAPGESREYSYMLYVGPRQKLLFESDVSPYAGFGLEQLVDFGWFEALARVLLAVLFGLHAVVGNWGVAIILLTFLVRGLLLPLSVWSQKNMIRMQHLAPEINKLKEKYVKKDGSMTPEQQRAFSAAQMDLFRKHGVNPIGCVGPIFLQMPIFIGLWNALNYSFELRHTEFFLWISDLSAPDVLFRLPFSIPILGTDAFSVLPLLMVASYMIQQKLQPAPADPRAAEQQKMMKWVMPIFGFILYTMPSGLMLYFLTSNLWSLVELKTIRKWVEEKEGGPAPAPAAG